MGITEHDDLHAIATEVRALTTILFKIMGHDLEQYLSEQGIPLSGFQYAVLRTLYYRQDAILSDLSQHMMVSPATLVPIVDALERHGFARRHRDPHDRRRTRLMVTARGADLIERTICPGRKDSLTEGLREMGAEKRRQLLALLRELAAKMHKDSDLIARMSAAIHAQFEKKDGQETENDKPPTT